MERNSDLGAGDLSAAAEGGNFEPGINNQKAVNLEQPSLPVSFLQHPRQSLDSLVQRDCLSRPST